MKMLETQITQLASHLTSNEGKQSKIRKGNSYTFRERDRRSSMTNKEDNSTSELGIVTEEPEFEMINHENTRILPGKICQRLGKTNNRFDKFVEVVRRLNINMRCSMLYKSPLTHAISRTSLQITCDQIFQFRVIQFQSQVIRFDY
jgi:hypothetical protein